MKKTIRLLLFMLLTCAGVSAQPSQAKIDSLIRILSTQSGQERVLTLIQLSEAYRESSAEKTYETADSASRYADEAGLNNMQGTILLSIGKSATILGDYPMALDYLGKAVKAFEKSENFKGLINSNISIANVYKNMAEYTEADKFYIKAIHLAQENSLVSHEAASELNRGNMFFAIGDYTRAMESYQATKKNYESLNDSGRLASSLSNIGLIYWQWNKNDLALEMLLRSKDIFEEKKNYVELGKIYNNIGRLYHQDFHDTTKALEYYQKSLKIREEIGNQLGMAVVLANIGSIYGDSQQYEKAFEYFYRSLSISRMIGYKEGILLGTFYSGIEYQNKKDYEKSNILMDSAYNMSKRYGINNYLPMINEAKLNNYAALGQYPEFLAEFKEYQARHESLKSEVDELRFSELEARNEAERTKKTLEKIESENRQYQHQMISRNSLIGFLLLIIFALTVAVVAQNKK